MCRPADALNESLAGWLRGLGCRPAFAVYGKSQRESRWRIIDVFATPRRNDASRWPLWRGTCTTWSSGVIAVGRDFAKQVLDEQERHAATRERAVSVPGGRLRDAAGDPHLPATWILAHECGHTHQALRLGPLYWPFVGAVTLCREGPRAWNRFENDASEQGLFGGIVPGTVALGLANPHRAAVSDGGPYIDTPGRHGYDRPRLRIGPLAKW